VSFTKDEDTPEGDKDDTEMFVFTSGVLKNLLVPVPFT
jgi:hypothetical protein